MIPRSASTIPDADKAREQLLAELLELRARNVALERYEARAQQLEASLRNSEGMTRLLLEQKLYGVWVNVGNKVAYINEAGARILGASNPGEVIGKPLPEVIHPDYHDIVRERIKAMGSGDSAVPMIEEKYVRVDGQAVDVDVWAMKFLYKGEPAILVAFKDITGRKRVEAALRESEAKYRDLVESANSIIIRWDLKGNLTFFNEFAEAFFGYPASEVIGRNVMDTIVPESESTGRDLTDMIRDIERHPERYKTNANENMRRNGERVWISWTNRAIRDSRGNVVEILSVGNDITERRRAEEALKKSEQFLNNVLDCIHDGISILDKGLNIIRVNHVMEEWYAHAMPFPGKKCYDVYHGESQPCVVCPSRRAIEQGSVQSEVLPFHDENGKIKGWHEVFAFPLKDDNGDIVGVIEHVRNITERKRAEEALSKNLAVLAKSQEIGRLASWSFDPGSERFEISDEMYRLYGFEPGAVEPTKGLLYKLIHPDDLARYREWFESLVMGGRLGSIDYRVVWPDGSVHYLHAIADSNVRSPDGRIKGMSGITQDITERKLAEEALRISQARLVKAQQIGRIGNWEWDIENDVELRREELRKFYDFNMDAGTVQDFLGVVHPDDREYVKSSIRAAVNGTKSYDVDFRILKEDHSIRYMHAEAEVIRNEAGKPVRMFGIGQDITDRKLAEEALKAAKAQAELYLDLMGHDINNMHQIALGYLEMAQDMPPGPMKDEMLAKPVEVLQRSAQLIQNVRKLQKHSDGLLQNSIIDVAELLPGVQREFGSMPGKVITLSLNECEHCFVMANELLHDVFANLVSNAIKHTGDSADIKIRLDLVKNGSGKYCRVGVEDNGPGIPDDLKTRIFNRVLKGTSKAKGMGLGLYLVKSLVDSYGGKVWVEDRVPGDHTKGARFVVMLPAIDN